MQFLVTAQDGTDEGALERRMNARPRHLENIKKVKEKGSVLCAGGITGPEGHVRGSFLVMEFETWTLLEDYLKTEPYVLEGVWQKIDIKDCNTVIMNDEMVGK